LSYEPIISRTSLCSYSYFYGSDESNPYLSRSGASLLQDLKNSLRRLQEF